MKYARKTLYFNQSKKKQKRQKISKKLIRFRQKKNDMNNLCKIVPQISD